MDSASSKSRGRTKAGKKEVKFHCCSYVDLHSLLCGSLVSNAVVNSYYCDNFKENGDDILLDLHLNESLQGSSTDTKFIPLQNIALPVV